MTMRHQLVVGGLACFAVLALSGAGAVAAGNAPAAKGAAAAVEPTQGHQVKGTITFTPVADGVRVVADLTGLTPGDHGFHIHEKGDCSAPDGTSAGGHFNPGNSPHGAPDAAAHHAGDLGNVTAGADGKAHLDQVFKFLSLSGPDTIVGRGLIVHAGKDDMTTQPTGNAGAREACGVIKEN
jgi:Cu-Zn family superoxide dismutase